MFLDAVIEEANWLTVHDDIKPYIGEGFDAVLCLGNSFAHMLDAFGDQREQRQALANFQKCVKPGGLLLIDHRNYDNIMDTGATPSKSIYYNVSVISSGKSMQLWIFSFARRRAPPEEAMNTNDFFIAFIA